MKAGFFYLFPVLLSRVGTADLPAPPPYQSDQPPLHQLLHQSMSQQPLQDRHLPPWTKRLKLTSLDNGNHEANQRLGVNSLQYSERPKNVTDTALSDNGVQVSTALARLHSENLVQDPSLARLPRAALHQQSPVYEKIFRNDTYIYINIVIFAASS